MAGTLTANGSGGFTRGTIDVGDPALGAALGTGYVFTGLPTSGNYNITSDGRANGTTCKRQPLYKARFEVFMYSDSAAWIPQS